MEAALPFPAAAMVPGPKILKSTLLSANGQKTEFSSSILIVINDKSLPSAFITFLSAISSIFSGSWAVVILLRLTLVHLYRQ